MSSYTSNALPPPGQQQQQQQPNLNVSYHTVTIQRDYSDIVTKFEKDFPNELQNSGITQEQFDYTITKINQWLEKAETVDSTNILEEFFGCITFFSLFLCYDDKYKKVIKNITQFIKEQNETIYQSKGVTLVNPMGNGFLKFEILVKYTSDPFSSGTTSPSSSSNNTTAVNNTQFSSSIPSSSQNTPLTSNNTTPIVSESVNNNNNNNNQTTPQKQNTSQFYKSYPIEEKVIQKPETIVNVNTNSHVVELSDDSDDSDSDADEAHYSGDSDDDGSDRV